MSDKKVFAIGQKLIISEDCEVEKAFGTKVILKKGTRLFIGADDFAHYLDGMLQSIGNAEKKGYSVSGIAEWIYEYVSRELPIDEMLENYDETQERFIECVADALEELGMYDGAGNRM